MLEQNVLDELKEKLLEEKKNLEEQLSRFAKPTGSKNDFQTQFSNVADTSDDDGDLDDEADQVEEYIDNLGVEKSLETQLRDVLDALKKMEEGIYGIDEKTGEEIDLARLRVFPSARTNVER